MSAETYKPPGAVGFYIASSTNLKRRDKGVAACERALMHFPWLKTGQLTHGSTQVYLWSQHILEESIHFDTKGNLYLLVGSPIADVSWKQALDALERAGDEAFELPWEGRCVILRISPDGGAWSMWNDWTGSIPVFHTKSGQGHVASTLEPAVVETAGFTPEDFFMPSLISLLINGHYLGDWTLFEGMRVVPPDCVAHWDENGFECTRLWAVKPSDERWDRGWGELIDEMYDLSRRAIAATLRTRSEWVLPLSGGLDSRSIAAVGAELGTTLHTYTYGHKDWVETVYARQVARALDLPWQRVPIEPDYLKRYTRLWLEWFGSALHCHGMYQVPFLESLEESPNGPILQGYMGDPLAGNHVCSLMASWDTEHGVMPGGSPFCEPDALEELMVFGFLKDAIRAVAGKIRQQVEFMPGALFQRLMFLDFWNRQRLFIYYQPMMYDYFRGVATPFLSRDYARFCLSLPRCALDNRRLQKDMLRRHYPRMARIGGTFGEPLLKTRRYDLKQAIAERLPRALRVGKLREFATTGNTIQTNALRSLGEECLWPLDNVRQRLEPLFDLSALEKVYEKAASGDEKAYNQLRPVQAIAWHYVRG